MAQGTSRGRQDKKQSVVIIPEGGRVPPQSPEMEEAVLGAAMLEIEAARMVVDMLRPEVFYSGAQIVCQGFDGVGLVSGRLKSGN